ncbi:hypothetical protein K502DRAFT_231468 [Neoconidiobolus thromboides FSU 785]|nr:hypothetical protein K502DRAFT_231468 [Neoconidiobolus thromboides FSU 785]
MSLRNTISSLFYHHGKVCSNHPLRILSLAFTWINILTFFAIYSFYFGTKPNYQFFENNLMSYNEIVINEEYQLKYQLVEIRFENDVKEMMNGPSLEYFMKVNEKLEAVAVKVKEEDGEKEYHFEDICFKPEGYGGCFMFNPIHYFVQNHTLWKKYQKEMQISLVENREKQEDLRLPLWAIFNNVKYQGEEVIGMENLVFTLFLNNRENSVKVWKLIWEKLKMEIEKIEVKDSSLISIENSNEENKIHYFQFINNKMLISAETMFMALGYIVVVLYLFFSISKFKLVKSKFWLGFAALFLLNVSLLMSFGNLIHNSICI